MIKTEYWKKPIPTNKHDWTAWVEGEEEFGCGSGPTEQAAIDDLNQWLELK